MTRGREDLLSRAFVDLADTLVNDYDVGEFLYLLAQRCVEVLDMTAAGVLLANERGELQLAASSERVHALELFEMQSREGPCAEAYRTGQQVVEREIDGGHRWPRFGSLALETGLRAVYAFPLRLRQERIGALNLFRSEAGAFGEEDVRAAQALADVATIGILQERTVREARVRAAQLQYALDSRVVIEQAKGLLAERLGIDVNVAFELLRGHARRNGRPLRTVAGEVVEGTLDVDQLKASRA